MVRDNNFGACGCEQGGRRPADPGAASRDDWRLCLLTSAFNSPSAHVDDSSRNYQVRLYASGMRLSIDALSAPTQRVLGCGDGEHVSLMPLTLRRA